MDSCEKSTAIKVIANSHAEPAGIKDSSDSEPSGYFMRSQKAKCIHLSAQRTISTNERRFTRKDPSQGHPHRYHIRIISPRKPSSTSEGPSTSGTPLQNDIDDDNAYDGTTDNCDGVKPEKSSKKK